MNLLNMAAMSAMHSELLKATFSSHDNWSKTFHFSTYISFLVYKIVIEFTIFFVLLEMFIYVKYIFSEISGRDS